MKSATISWSSSIILFFFSSRRRHTRSKRDWSSDVCSSDLFRYTQHVHPRFKCTGCTLDCGVINLIPFIKRIYLIEDFEAPLQVETEIHILHDVLQSKTDYCKKNDGNHE